MHHLDLGLFKYQITYTQEHLKTICGQAAVDDFDNRLAKIPRFPGLKVFKKGIGEIKQMTADELRNLMKYTIFVVDGLMIEHRKRDVSYSRAERQDQELTSLFVNWNLMYIFSRKEEISESELKTFKVCYLEIFSLL